VLRIDILTILPEMIEQALNHSIMKRARDAGLVEINAVNLRDFTTDKHHVTDDTPVGGGGGMIMKVDPIARALDALRLADKPGQPCSVILTDPRGETFTQAKARELAAESHLIFICGHYEGVDERVREHLVTDTLSIGDYVLTGGELPALVMADAVTRLQPGALGDEDAPHKDSFSEPLLEYPQYTRPRSFRGWEVPEILFGGHHALITRWRRKKQLLRTRGQRPDLWGQFSPSKEDLKLLDEEEPSS
jgi:tRNA (guanine37-N1)-methyltransferase